jgi:hypothetical protein
LYKRIATSDKARLMPPTSSHRHLTPDQIATIKSWIDQGANWSEHWAFKAPVKAGGACRKESSLGAQSH